MIAVHIFRWLCLVAGIGWLLLALLGLTPAKGTTVSPEAILSGFEAAFVLLAVWALLTVLSARRAS